MTYSPTNANVANAQVEVPYTEPASTGPVSTRSCSNFREPRPNSRSATFWHRTITSSRFSLTAPSHSLPRNSTPLRQANLNINDMGSGPGTITNDHSRPSTVFKLSGTPLFPYTISASNTILAIGILYTPTAIENDTGQITITYQDGSTAIVNLTGSGSSSSYTYTYLSGTGAKPTSVKSGGTITFLPANAPTAGTPAGASSVIVQVTNRETPMASSIPSMLQPGRSNSVRPRHPSHSETRRRRKFYHHLHPHPGRHPNRYAGRGHRCVHLCRARGLDRN